MTKKEIAAEKSAGKKYQKNRAKKLNTVLKKWGDPQDPIASVTGMLADLRHFCTVYGIDFYACDRSAHHHYSEEQAGRIY